MEFKDYYKIMEVARDATQDEIKRSYRKLARKFHPDVSKEVDAEAHFKELGEAYEVLKDNVFAQLQHTFANWLDVTEDTQGHPPKTDFQLGLSPRIPVSQSVNGTSPSMR